MEIIPAPTNTGTPANPPVDPEPEVSIVRPTPRTPPAGAPAPVSSPTGTSGVPRPVPLLYCAAPLALAARADIKAASQAPASSAVSPLVPAPASSSPECHYDPSGPDSASKSTLGSAAATSSARLGAFKASAAAVPLHKLPSASPAPGDPVAENRIGDPSIFAKSGHGAPSGTYPADNPLPWVSAPLLWRRAKHK